MLDGGPSRISGTRDRQSTRQPRHARQTPEAPRAQAAMQQATSIDRTSRDRVNTSQPGTLRLKVIAGIVLIVVLAGLVVAWMLFSQREVNPGIDVSKQQAVFFANGQIYFGKLELIDDKHMRLSNVFYIQPGETTNAGDESRASSAANNMQLIKLGEEVHGPEDAMIINRDQVLFFENLKPDGRVAQLIDDYKSGNN